MILRFLISAFAFMLCLSNAVKAHPHVFIDVGSQFIFSPDKQLKSLRISWTYDEFTTLILFDLFNLDSDNDGVLSDEDKAAIIEGETNWRADYKGDIYLEVNNKDYPLGRPEAAIADFSDNKITLSFELPLSEPVNISNIPIVLRVYDPMYYYKYEIISAENTPDQPQDCRHEILTFQPDPEDRALQDQLAALSQDEVPEDQDVGRQFSDEVILSCG